MLLQAADPVSSNMLIERPERATDHSQADQHIKLYVHQFRVLFNGTLASEAALELGDHRLAPQSLQLRRDTQDTISQLRDFVCKREFVVVDPSGGDFSVDV